MRIPSVLSIAGSDSSGGAGIQADIKTISAFGLFAQTAITALTAQNTLGVHGVLDVDPGFVEEQIDAVFNDIRPDAVKIGMVSSPEIVIVIAESLKRHGAGNIVVDPVMVATSGDSLAAGGAVEALCDHLLPMADVITPNMPEACVLAGYRIESREEQERAAQELLATGAAAVLVKGGHGQGDAYDVLAMRDGGIVRLEAARIETSNTHGTGCTLSSAIACGLAKGESLEDAVRHAKEYVSGALASGLDLGRGCGPIDHMWRYR